MQQPMPKTTNQPGENAKLRTGACPKCAHHNAPDSRFCSACGIPLSVAACQKCGALNPATAPFCHQCNSVLQEDAAEAYGSASEIIDGYKPPPRPPIPVVAWFAGGLILAAIGFFAFQAYQLFSYVDIPYEQATLPGGSSDLEKRRGSSASGIISRPSATSGEVAEEPAREPVAPATLPSNAKPEPAGTTRAPAETRAETNRKPVKAATSVAPAPPIVEIKPAARASKATSACTAGVWALGLCGTEAVQPKE